jgi:hypothetical protein
MKRIIVLIDGTWNKEGVNADTNVAKLDPNNKKCVQRIIKPEAVDGTVQEVFYHDGVGTDGGLLERLLGGAIGLGLKKIVQASYNFVVDKFNAQSLRAGLGCPEPVHHRELHIPNHERVQSDAHHPGARLYERRRDREPLQQEFGITPVVLARSSEGDRKTPALLHWHLGPALAGPSISGGAGRFFGGVTLEMYNEFPHQAPVTERPVAL